MVQAAEREHCKLVVVGKPRREVEANSQASPEALELSDLGSARVSQTVGDSLPRARVGRARTHKLSCYCQYTSVFYKLHSR